MSPYFYTAHALNHNPRYLQVNMPREYVEAIATHLGVSVEELHQGYKLEANYFGSASIVYRFVPKSTEASPAPQENLGLRIAPGVPPPTGLPQPPVTPSPPTPTSSHATPSLLSSQPSKPPLEVLEWWEPPAKTA